MYSFRRCCRHGHRLGLGRHIIDQQRTSGRLYSTIDVSTHINVTTVKLNQPQMHNAFNDGTIKELQHVFNELHNDNDVRAVILTGEGKSFSAGADLNWMKKMVNYTSDDNVRDSLALFDMLYSIHTCPVPVIGRINGSALGGGCGLVSVCDMSFAVEKAVFGFTEVKLGLVPAVISPFVLKKIRRSNASRYFLTGERFTATIAQQIGLVHSVVSNVNELDKSINNCIQEILYASPTAVKTCKQLINYVDDAKQTPMTMRKHVAETIASARVSSDGQDGLGSFLQKQQPTYRTDWTPPPQHNNNNNNNE